MTARQGNGHADAGTSTRRPRVACIDDSTVASAGVCRLFASWRIFEMVHDVARAEMAVLVIGTDRAAGLARAREIARTTRLLVVGPVDLTAVAVRAGAAGFATMAAGGSELRAIALAVAAGRRSLSRDATEALIDAATVRPAALEELSPRQVDLLRRVCAGQSLTAIARDLGVSRQAIGQALERLRDRAGAATNRELVEIARERELVTAV